MAESLDLDLLVVDDSRGQVYVFFDDAPLHAEPLAVRARLPDDAPGPIALLAALADAVVAHDCAPSPALEALPRLTALLGPRALARVTDRPLVNLDERLDSLEGVHELYRHLRLVIRTLRLILHTIRLLLMLVALLAKFKEVIKFIPNSFRIVLFGLSSLFVNIFPEL